MPDCADAQAGMRFCFSDATKHDFLMTWHILSTSKTFSVTFKVVLPAGHTFFIVLKVSSSKMIRTFSHDYNKFFLCFCRLKITYISV